MSAHRLCALVVLGLAFSGCKQFSGPKTKTLDHYQAYVIEPPVGFEKPVHVALTGQFDRNQPRPHRLLALTHFANPVSKNDEPIVNEATHLTWYRLEPTKEPLRKAWYENQFTNNEFFEIHLKDPQFLLVPARKSENDHEHPGKPPRDVEHFKCYQVVSGRGLERSVTLRDQFGLVDAVIDGPYFFAVPVVKSGEGHRKSRVRTGIERDHLAIYRIMRGAYAKEKRLVTDQFTPPPGRVLEIRRRYYLCVPSAKKWDPPQD